MKTHIELTPRLRTVADLVPEGARLADIGTDHAYLPAALLLEEKIPGAIAADLREGPLNRAKQTAAEYGLGDKITFRLCNGLAGIQKEEVDAVAIAGMGGETIADILSAALWVREQNIPLILQPMSSMTDLRIWLESSGFAILEERLAREGDTLYVILSVRAGEMDKLTPAQLWAGKNSPDLLRGEWLDLWLGKVQRALDGLSRSNKEDAARRMEELTQVKTGLLEMKKEWEEWQR